MSKPVEPGAQSLKCARCRKRPVALAYRPFCSKRCADVDLGQWLTGGYAIPGAPAAAAGPAPPDDAVPEDASPGE